ncbi:MAG: purine-nucleoside phosphorylase [Candidatus Gastranaerophilales bacterium]|nr:purine-nucleoside phosphorylase [Candidatus Gastranaerophilales bacterium]
MINSLNYIKEKLYGIVPDVAVVLGSGLGSFTDGLEGITIPYAEISGFLTSNVQGHKGSLFYYEKNDKKILVMQGRFHYYEGHSMQEITYPVKVFSKLGIKKIILTNAAGSLDETLLPGDLMLIKDHINYMGNNPLIGKNDDSLGERFPDMSEIYSKKLRQIALLCAKECEIDLTEGVYAATMGPSYETPAEIKMLKIMGANVVGMSTIPEAIVANWCNMEVLGLSLVSNYAAGVKMGHLSHSEVIGAGQIASEKVKKLLNSILENI